MSNNSKDQKNDNSQEIQVQNLNAVALKEDETVRLIISESSDGTITISAKTKQPATVTYLVGLLEVAKNDVLTRQQEDQSSEVLVDIVLDELDFEMDHQGSLKKQGKVVGDTIQMPSAIAELRQAAKQQFTANKANTAD